MCVGPCFLPRVQMALSSTSLESTFDEFLEALQTGSRGSPGVAPAACPPLPRSACVCLTASAISDLPTFFCSDCEDSSQPLQVGAGVRPGREGERAAAWLADAVGPGPLAHTVESGAAEFQCVGLGFAASFAPQLRCCET